jgi:hypothetical protein
MCEHRELVKRYIRGLDIAKKSIPDTIEIRSLLDSALETQYTNIAIKANNPA